LTAREGVRAVLSTPRVLLWTWASGVLDGLASLLDGLWYEEGG